MNFFFFRKYSKKKVTNIRYGMLFRNATKANVFPQKESKRSINRMNTELENKFQFPNNLGHSQNQTNPPSLEMKQLQKKAYWSAKEEQEIITKHSETENRHQQDKTKEIPHPENKQKMNDSHIFSVPVEHHQLPKDIVSSHPEHQQPNYSQKCKSRKVKKSFEILKLESIQEEEDGLPVVVS